MSLVKSLDYETKTLAFNITVRIYDLDPVAPRSAEQEYRFCVTNVNDNVPVRRHSNNCFRLQNACQFSKLSLLFSLSSDYICI